MAHLVQPNNQHQVFSLHFVSLTFPTCRCSLSVYLVLESYICVSFFYRKRNDVYKCMNHDWLKVREIVNIYMKSFVTPVFGIIPSLE